MLHCIFFVFIVFGYRCFLQYKYGMRNNPRVLSYHMSMAASYWQQQFETGAQDAAAIQAQFQDMMRGIQKYLSYDYVRSDDHLEAIYEDGCASIFKLRDHHYDRDNPVLFLVPSLINKSHIFDLTDTQSMLRHFCDSGINAYLLDWGDFLHDQDMQNLSDIVLSKLASAVQFLADYTDADIHALGYCMGGSLLAGLASQEPQHLKSLTFMAAPWDFHAGTQDMLDRVKFWYPSLALSLKQEEAMKVDWLQILFSSLYPEQAMKKFSKFSKMDDGSDAADVFVAVEDWLNDGVPLPVGVANEVIQNWFFENGPIHSQWMLDDREVDLKTINIPSLVIASSEDKLVEYDMALPLQEGIKGAALLNPKCGHIGMVAGAKAIKNVWLPIEDWIKKNHT